jgi:DNA repair photolyase
MQDRPLELDSLQPQALAQLAEQADLTYHSAPAGGIFNSPSATNMGFWSINPYVGCAFACSYCYARDTHRWTLERAGAIGRQVAQSMPAWLAFERRILVKQRVGERIRAALRSGRAPRAGDSVVIGSATDPYQPAERRFRVTESALHALLIARDLSITIITKSPLVTRDVTLLRALGERHEVSVHISLICADRELARRLEPRAPTPESRLRAVRRLADANIAVSVNCMPVLPGITDSDEALDTLAREVAAAGARSMGAAALRLRASARRRYLPVIREGFPQLAGRYEATYTNSMHTSETYRTELQQRFEAICARHGLTTRAYRKRAERDEKMETALPVYSDEQLVFGELQEETAQRQRITSSRRDTPIASSSASSCDATIIAPS